MLSRRPVNKDGISTRGLKILVEKQNNRFAPSYLQKMERTKASLKVKAKGGSAWSRRLCICCNVLARVVVCVGKAVYLWFYELQSLQSLTRGCSTLFR